MKILTFIDHYLPGHKAGGPVRSISSMVDALPASLEFLIVTRDRDLQDGEPYPDVSVGCWNAVGRAKVLYLAPAEVTIRRLVEVAKEEKPDVVYLNGLFSRMSLRFLLARRLGWVPVPPVVLAPRGELAPGALRLKGLKKRIFIAVARLTGVLSGITWHASTEFESQEIRDVLGKKTVVSVARNLVAASDGAGLTLARQQTPRPLKRPGIVRFVFVSRISPKKNLMFALRLLSRVRGDVAFDIYGPAEDRDYWASCRALMSELPPNATASYKGAVPPERVGDAFRGAHFFVFPTFGENFGHVIYESLAAGCPVVLSDRTPWAAVRAGGAGWTIPLGDEHAWLATLQSCVDMSSSDYQRMVEAAPKAAASFADKEASVGQNVELFMAASRVNSARVG